MLMDSYNRFCPRCGTATVYSAAARGNICPNCSKGARIAANNTVFINGGSGSTVSISGFDGNTVTVSGAPGMNINISSHGKSTNVSVDGGVSYSSSGGGAVNFSGQSVNGSNNSLNHVSGSSSAVTQNIGAPAAKTAAASTPYASKYVPKPTASAVSKATSDKIPTMSEQEHMTNIRAIADSGDISAARTAAYKYRSEYPMNYRAEYAYAMAYLNFLRLEPVIALIDGTWEMAEFYINSAIRFAPEEEKLRLEEELAPYKARLEVARRMIITVLEARAVESKLPKPVDPPRKQPDGSALEERKKAIAEAKGAIEKNEAELAKAKANNDAEKLAATPITAGFFGRHKAEKQRKNEIDELVRRKNEAVSAAEHRLNAAVNLHKMLEDNYKKAREQYDDELSWYLGEKKEYERVTAIREKELSSVRAVLAQYEGLAEYHLLKARIAELEAEMQGNSERVEALHADIRDSNAMTLITGKIHVPKESDGPFKIVFANERSREIIRRLNADTYR